MFLRTKENFSVVKVMIAGTREPSPQGAALARRVGYTLAQRGITLITGGAPGVDVEALRGAIKAGGRILLVLPYMPPPFRYVQELLSKAERRNGCYYVGNATVFVKAGITPLHVYAALKYP